MKSIIFVGRDVDELFLELCLKAGCGNVICTKPWMLRAVKFCPFRFYVLAWLSLSLCRQTCSTSSVVGPRGHKGGRAVVCSYVSMFLGSLRDLCLS